MLLPPKLPRWSRAEVYVLGYFSIGEAENYLSYFSSLLMSRHCHRNDPGTLKIPVGRVTIRSHTGRRLG